MAERQEITIEPGFICAVLPATTYTSSKQDVFTRAADAARNAGVSKILYDARNATGHLSTLERFDYASRIAEQFRGLKVAFVVNKPLRDPNLFGETVAVNRGGNIRVLSTIAEAYDWLGVKPANEASAGDGH
ncbi:MAG: hypothetical protein HKP58_15245 [Desulfatitalea sp.]|nr:hypothetical protein [Desulfatitalea sp.]NNK01765.1 hypothetical protein [Desulfatitalea sp.]